MNCKEFREVLDLYIDEELSPEALIAAQLHSGECMACQAATEKLLSIRQLLKANNARHQLPDELVGAVHKISRPWWKPVFHDPKASASRTYPLAVWHRQITLSASTFVRPFCASCASRESLICLSTRSFTFAASLIGTHL